MVVLVRRLRLVLRDASGKIPKIAIDAPLPGAPETAEARFKFSFYALRIELELPVDKEDILAIQSEPEIEYPVKKPAREQLLSFIVHGTPSAQVALSGWIGKQALDTLRLELMRYKINESGMEMEDFSRNTRVMLPLLNDKWRGDAQTINTIMREIAIFRGEKSKKQEEVESKGAEEVLQRKTRIGVLNEDLKSVGIKLEDLPWSGPEPTRFTYNRIVDTGNQFDEWTEHRGLSPQSLLDRWNAGIRRLRLEERMKEARLDPKELMLDEKIFNLMVVYMELGKGDPDDVVYRIRDIIENGKGQWTRKKRRSSRWGFNFD